MSGGIAYVLDEDATLYRKVNKTMVSLEPVTDKYDVLELKEIIAEHVCLYKFPEGQEDLRSLQRVPSEIQEDCTARL